MAKFTPWFATEVNTFDVDKDLNVKTEYEVQTAEGETIATVTPGHLLRERDAYLLAAAPLLFDALELVLNTEGVDDILNNCGREGIALAALNYAKGT